MRVLMVCGPASGGIRRHLEVLLGSLPGRGVEAAAAVPASVRLPEESRRFAMDVADRPRPARDLAALRTLRAAARSFQPDLVHAHGVKAALLALVAFPPGRPPVVVTLHNLWTGGALRPLLAAAVPRAAGVVGVSRAVLDSYARAGIDLPAPCVIHHGLDLAAYPPAAWLPPGSPFNALYAGRLTEEKGILVLLEAIPPHEEPSLRLQIAGEGPLRAEVEARTDLQYLGRREHVQPLYAAAHAVVVPSLAEGFGLTALEAMACGRPVIASRTGGLPELVVDGETGLLVPPGDAAALAAALRSLAADPERAREMGQAGRQRVEREFTLDQMVKRLLTVYGAAAPEGVRE